MFEIAKFGLTISGYRLVQCAYWYLPLLYELKTALQTVNVYSFPSLKSLQRLISKESELVERKDIISIAGFKLDVLILQVFLKEYKKDPNLICILFTAGNFPNLIGFYACCFDKVQNFKNNVFYANLTSPHVTNAESVNWLFIALGNVKNATGINIDWFVAKHHVVTVRFFGPIPRHRIYS